MEKSAARPLDNSNGNSTGVGVGRLTTKFNNIIMGEAT